MGGFSVDGRVEVLATGQDEGVDAVQHAGEGGGVLGDGEQERRASGLDDGLAVFAADAGVVVGHGAGDADDGIVVSGLFRGGGAGAGQDCGQCDGCKDGGFHFFGQLSVTFQSYKDNDKVGKNVKFALQKATS